MRKIWNKGHCIRASDKHLVYHFSIGTLLLRQFQEAPAPSKAGTNEVALKNFTLDRLGVWF